MGYFRTPKPAVPAFANRCRNRFKAFSGRAAPNGSLMHSPTQPKTQAQYFRAKSVECLERSLRVPDPEYQRLYCELAAQWLVLAHEAESDEARVVVVTASKKESPATGGANAKRPKLEAPPD